MLLCSLEILLFSLFQIFRGIFSLPFYKEDVFVLPCQPFLFKLIYLIIKDTFIFHDR